MDEQCLSEREPSLLAFEYPIQYPIFPSSFWDETMGFNRDAASSSSSPSPLLDKPQQILGMVSSDYIAACTLLSNFSTKEVRTLLAHAKTQKINFIHELFKIFISVHEKKALELTVNLPSTPLGQQGSKDAAIKEMTDSGMLKHADKGMVFGVDKDEYPVYDSEKREVRSLTIYLDDRSSFNEKNAQTAYDAFLQRKYVQQTFPEVLTRFLEKSNQIIAGMTSPHDVIQLLCQLGNWKLLSEFLLRVETDKKWVTEKGIFEKLFDRAAEIGSKTDTADYSEFKRCIYILKERVGLAYQGGKMFPSKTLLNDIYQFPANLSGRGTLFLYAFTKPAEAAKTFQSLNDWNVAIVSSPGETSNLSTDIHFIEGYHKYAPVQAGSHLIHLFNHVGRIDQVRILLSSTSGERKGLLALCKDGETCPQLAFLEDVFSEFFPYTTQTDFDWLAYVNLSQEFTQDQNRSARLFSQIIEKEMFDAVYYLFKSLNNQVRINLLMNFTPAAWDAIIEFYRGSKNLLDLIISTLPASDDKLFGAFLDTSTINILDLLLQTNRPEDAQRLYEKFGALFNARDNYAASIQRLISDTENQITKQIKDDYQHAITQHESLVEKILQPYILAPETFVQLLQSNFPLAYQYFKRMNQDQKRTMATNALEQRVRLIETLLELNAFAGQPNTRAAFHVPDFELTMDVALSQKDAQGKPLSERFQRHDMGSLYGDNSYRLCYSGMSYGTNWSRINGMSVLKFCPAPNDWYNEVLLKYLEYCKYFIISDFMKPATQDMALDFVSNLPVSPFMTWPEDDSKVFDIFMGLILNQNEHMIRIMIINSNAKLLRILFMQYSNNELRRNTFIAWITTSHEQDYPIRLLFQSLDLDLVKGYLSGLDQNSFMKITIKLLSDNTLTDESKRMACFAIARMPSPADFFKSFFTAQIAKLLLLPHNITYAKAIHSLAPEYFKESFVDFHLAIKETYYDYSDNTFIAELESARKTYCPHLYPPQYAAIEPNAPPPVYTEFAPCAPPSAVAEPSQVDHAMIDRVTALEQQIMHQNILMGHLVTAMQMMVHPVVDNSGLMQAQERIHELEVEKAQRELVETSEKEKAERVQKNLMRFSRGLPEEKEAKPRLKRTHSF